MLQKKFSMNVMTLIIVALIGYFAYYFLLHADFFSISSIIENVHNLAFEQHILVLGLLPIYIASIIFGSGLAGLYLSARLKHFLIHRNEK